MVHIDLSEVLRRQYIDAAADLNPVLHALIDKEVLYGLKYILFILAHLLIICDQAENREMVPVNTRNDLIL